MRHLKINNLHIITTERSDGNMKDLQVRENFIKKLNLPVYLPAQEHTTVITTPEEDLKPADGVFISKKGVAGGVLTADCMPVVLTDFERLVVIHAGWRGLIGGIIENGIKMLEGGSITAFIGASARKCCYEVQEDFVKSLQEKGLSGKYFHRRNGRITFSMQDYAKDLMLKRGIKRLFDISLCTICGEEFFSYRKGDFYERILTLAWLEG
ncbi:MAG: polyphenol oxidase family protein [Aquificae bacterium]|nr:polyphenol oxidase family protein [Aquificota bacterium]